MGYMLNIIAVAPFRILGYCTGECAGCQWGNAGGWWMNGDGLIEPEAKEQVIGGEDS